jgi:hypothetical protein
MAAPPGLADRATASYRRALAYVGSPTDVTIRRYSGTGGSRTSVDYGPVSARVLKADPAVLEGAIQQARQTLILMAQDLVDLDVPLPPPLRNSDVAVIRGREFKLLKVDDNTRRVAGTLVAYELEVEG